MRYVPLRTLLIAFLVLLGSSTHSEEQKEKWSVLSSDYYQLFYHPDYEKDGKKVKELLDSGIEALKKEFKDHPVDQLLRVDCKIFLYPTRSEKASEYMAKITTGRDNKGKYSAVIDLLPPSAYDTNYRSNVGEPPGYDYFSKLVVHEYSTILLEQLTRSKKKGWRFFDAPKWFTDGYEEYLGLTLSAPRNRKEVLNKYLATHKENPNRIDFDFGISITNDYIDGALLLLFMNESFGRQKVQAILTSEEPRFGKAVTSSLGVNLEEFKKRWEEWIQKKIK
jgi:hypothetical protein